MIILLGGYGYVGSAFARYFEISGIPFRSLRRTEHDYTKLDGLRDLIRDVKPTFLINCAGYTGKPNVDACELHKTECLFGNAVLPGIIRQACEDTATAWGHISSGCIYTGTKSDGSGFGEEDSPNFSFRQNNCSFYSGTKALGEEILAGATNCYIWRLRIPFNEVDNPRNYLTKVMRYDRLLAAQNSLSQLDEFVRAAVDCWQKRVPFGIYNVTNPGSITTHEVVDLIQQSGLIKKQFDFFTNEDEFMRLAAKTPRSNCLLDTTKLQKTGIKMAEVHEAITRALSHWQVG